MPNYILTGVVRELTVLPRRLGMLDLWATSQ